MRDHVFAGYVYSYITKTGSERLVMGSFGTTKTKSKRYFKFQNQSKLEPLKPHKRYIVQVKVIEEVANAE
jgi:hypothetical protein